MTFMHLADAFTQSDLQCIQAIHFFVKKNNNRNAKVQIGYIWLISYIS